MTEENDPKQANVRIKVDNAATEELVKLLKEKEAKKEDNLAERKLQAYEKFHNERFLTAQTKEELTDMLTAHINEVAEKDKPTPSGSARLSPKQYGEKEYSLYEKPYNRETLDELQRLSAEGNTEAHDILTALLKKWARDKHSNPNTPDSSFNPNSKESLDELDLVQKDGFLTPRDKESGDLQKLQRRWRLARKQREGNTE